MVSHKILGGGGECLKFYKGSTAEVTVLDICLLYSRGYR